MANVRYITIKYSILITKYKHKTLAVYLQQLSLPGISLLCQFTWTHTDLTAGAVQEHTEEGNHREVEGRLVDNAVSYHREQPTLRVQKQLRCLGSKGSEDGREP